jgi:hypothetical protein
MLQDLLAAILEHCSHRFSCETDMRALFLTFALGLALSASAQAAPLAPMALTPVTYLPDQEWVPLSNEASREAAVDVPPPVEVVAAGCGRSWHRHHRRDGWGYWHWGPCVPNW